MHAITMDSFLSFLAYFGSGALVLLVGVFVVALVTPHKDFTLIRQGNAAAAIAFAGTLIGIALPLHSAISHSVSLMDAVIWGAVATVIQVVAYLAARTMSSRLSHQITDGVSAAGIFAAGVSISVGLINAAAMTP
ncbi:MAG: DUF350 domain-containing protein [Pseudomonadota bacterium]|nr:DUF350 domain-containing protein [Pseudomonadota bacterium]